MDATTLGDDCRRILSEAADVFDRLEEEPSEDEGHRDAILLLLEGIQIAAHAVDAIHENRRPISRGQLALSQVVQYELDRERDADDDAILLGVKMIMLSYGYGDVVTWSLKPLLDQLQTIDDDDAEAVATAMREFREGSLRARRRRER
jgi:hypothetical protein